MYENFSFRTLRKGTFPQTNKRGRRTRGLENGKPTDKVSPNCYAMDFQVGDFCWSNYCHLKHDLSPPSNGGEKQWKSLDFQGNLYRLVNYSNLARTNLANLDLLSWVIFFRIRIRIYHGIHHHQTHHHLGEDVWFTFAQASYKLGVQADCHKWSDFTPNECPKIDGELE